MSISICIYVKERKIQQLHIKRAMLIPPPNTEEHNEPTQEELEDEAYYTILEDEQDII